MKQIPLTYKINEDHEVLMGRSELSKELYNMLVSEPLKFQLCPLYVPKGDGYELVEISIHEIKNTENKETNVNDNHQTR